jgi:hypothetical protein
MVGKKLAYVFCVLLAGLMAGPVEARPRKPKKLKPASAKTLAANSAPAPELPAPPVAVEATPSAPSRERILDKPARHGAGYAVARIPLYPFIGLGKGFERGLRAVEENHLIEKQAFATQWLADRHMQLLFGGLGTGAGMALGINFFDNHPDGRFRWQVPLRISNANYQQFETALSYSFLPKHRLFLEGRARYRNRPQEDYFGPGPSSTIAGRSNFQLQDRSIGGAIGSEFAAGARVDFSFSYVNANVGPGRDNAYPDTAAIFPALPGLARGSAILKYGVSAVYPRLDNPLDPHRGIRLRARFLLADSRNADNFNFYDYGASGDFYLPLGGPRTLALRAVADFRSPRNGGAVPFYAQPFLGGSSTLRGYREFRFYDNNALLFNAEYRWRVWKLVDLAGFFDAGQVAPSVRALDLDGFRKSYGGGLRFRGAKGVLLRFDVGHSREGTRYYFTFSPEF